MNTSIRINLSRLILVLVIVLSPSPGFAKPFQHGEVQNAQTGAVCHHEGEKLLDTGQVEAALEKFEETRLVHQKAGAKVDEALCLLMIGVSKDRLFDYQGASEAYKDSLPLLPYLNDYYGWTILNNLGLDYRKLGQYQEAIASYQQALKIAETPGFLPALKGRTLNNIGAAYLMLGQFEEARKSFEDALPFREKGSEEEMNTLNNLGEVSRGMADYDQALEYYDRALQIAEGLNDPKNKGVVFNNLGLTHNEMGDYQQAESYYEDALKIHRATENQPEIATTLNNLGKLYFETGRELEAIGFLEEALNIHETLDDRAKREIALTNLGYVHEQTGRNDQAISRYQEAVDLLEAMQNDIKVEELKAAFIAENMDAHLGIINVLWNEGRFEESFHYAERARARAFLDQLANQRIDFRAGADATLLERRQELLSEIAALRDELVILRNGPSTEQIKESMAEIEKSLEDREAAYTRLRTEMQLQNPELASLFSVDADSLSLTNIQNLLDAQTTLVEYFVMDDRVLIFVVTRNRLDTTTVDIPKEQLLQTIESLYPFASLDDPHPSSVQQLYTWLIAPVKDKLRTRVVGIVPHNVLHYIPFSALSDGDSYLIDDYILFSLPSAGTLRFVQERRETTISNVLILGNPSTDLPELSYAEEEAMKIAGLYGAAPLLGEAATESVLAAQASEADVLHLAAHGKYDTSNPLFSVIRLARDSQNDGWLQADEVYELDLTKTTDLVVLSACQTSLGALKDDTVSKGDEIVGLNRAFLYAGTPTVMASLWNVSDASTARLMEKFYSHLKSGKSKGEALRQAQIELQKEYPHPYHWAAFVLTGDPGQGTQGEAVLVPDTGSQRWWPVGLAGAGLLTLCCFGIALILGAGLAWNRYRKKVRS